MGCLEYKGKKYTEEEFRIFAKEEFVKNSSTNKFMSILEKDGNWIRYFIQAILQDSAKKGYEFVLFPKGDTASKVEGHTTLQEFKRQKEERIKELEKDTENNPFLVNDDGYIHVGFSNKEEAEKFKENRDKEVGHDIYIEGPDRNSREIKQLQEELKRVETEGFGALKPIHKFYEETVSNILKKLGKVEDYTDEYGNKWNKVEIGNKDISPFALLRKIEEQPKDKQERVAEKIKNWLYTKGLDKDRQFNANQQVNIVNSIRGVVFHDMTKAVFEAAKNGKKAEIHVLDKKGQLMVKQYYSDKLSVLDSKDKEGLLTPEEVESKRLLETTLDKEIWPKIQDKVLRDLATFGFKPKNGDKSVLEGEEEGVSKEAIIETNKEVGGDEESYIDAEEGLEGLEGEAGRGSTIGDEAIMLLNLKDTMSSRLKVWLSAIPSGEDSVVPVGEHQNTFVGTDDLMKAIYEASKSKSTPDEILGSLEAVGGKYLNKAYLLEVAKRLREEQIHGNKIANEFFSKFNVFGKEYIILATEAQDRGLGEWKNGKLRYSVKETDSNGEFVKDTQTKVINANRISIPRNLRESWYNTLSDRLGLPSDNIEDENPEVTPDTKELPKLYKAYLQFKDEMLTTYFKDGQLINPKSRPEVVEKLKSLLESVGIEHLQSSTLDNIIDGKLPKTKFDKGGTFNSKGGTLATIFEQLNSDNPNLEKFHDSTGSRRIAVEEGNKLDTYMNTSFNDAKGRSIWGYGLHTPLSREFTKITQDRDYVNKLLGNSYNSKSEILSKLTNLSGEERSTYLANLQLGYYNATKSSVKSQEAKELTQMVEYEFTNSQLQLFMNSLSEVDNHKWSFKFTSSFSDKGTMPILKTPDTKVSFDNNKTLIGVDKNTLHKFYGYFQGEYNRVKSYLEADEEHKKAWDDISTFEPKLFYHFGIFNFKSKFLWKEEDGKYKLRDLDEVTDGIKTSTYIQDNIRNQVNQDIEQTTTNLENLRLIKDGKYIYGFDRTYFENVVPKDISLSKELTRVRSEYGSKIITEEQFKDEMRAIRQASDKRVTKYMVMDYAVNYHLHNIEMHMSGLLGDPSGYLKSAKDKLTDAQFNNNSLKQYTSLLNRIRENMNKRQGSLIGPGSQSSGTLDPNTPIGLLTINDPKVLSKIIDNIREFNKSASSNFIDIQNMDGQEIITAEHDLDLKYDFGKLDKGTYELMKRKVARQHQDIENQGFVSKDNLFTDDENLIAQPQKPLIAANIQNDYLKTQVPTIVKSSAYGMYPQFTQGLDIDILRKGIYEHNKTKPNIDRISALSAAKEGALNPLQNFVNLDGTFNPDALKDIDPETIAKIPKEYFRIQLEVPIKDDEDIRMFTQYEKSAFAEVLDQDFNTSHIQGLPKSMKGTELRQYRDGVLTNLLGHYYDQLLDDTGAKANSDGSYSYKDLSKLNDSIQRQAISLGWQQNEIDALQLTDDKKQFTIPIAFSTNPKKYENLLMSLIDSSIQQRTNGKSYILTSEQGMKPTPKTKVLSGEEAKDWINYNRNSVIWMKDSFDPSKGLLPQRLDEEDYSKTKPGQVLITWNFKDANGKPIDINQFIKTEGSHSFLDTSKIDPEILKMIGLKIPLQGHPTVTHIEIAGFIPKIMGDMMIASQDLTKQAGIDYDIDKLNCYKYNYQVVDGKLQKFDYTDKEEVVDRRKFDKDVAPYSKLVSNVFNTSDDPKDNFERQVRDKKIKVLQNKLLDVYSTVASHPEVYGKMLEGVGEGKLHEVAEKLSSIRNKVDTELPSMSSERYKITEYINGQSSKLGIAVFNLMNTYLSTVEGKGIKLSRPITQKEQQSWYASHPNGESPPNIVDRPFLIKDDSGKVHPLLELAGKKGWSRLVSMDQTVSVDNVKLGLMGPLNMNKYTMGVMGLMDGLANDRLKDSSGGRLYDEEYIKAFTNQPGVLQYIDLLKERDTQDPFNRDTVNDLRKNILTQYYSELGRLDPNRRVEPYPGYTRDELWEGIDLSNRDISHTDEEHVVKQIHILGEYFNFEDVSNEIRFRHQPLLNSDSKGTPKGGIAEALTKRSGYDDLMKRNSNLLSNTDRIFRNEDGSPTLAQVYYQRGVELPISLYSGSEDSPSILPQASKKAIDFLQSIRELQNKNGYNPFNKKFSNAIWNSQLSYEWSYPSHNIAEGDISPERESLLRDLDKTKSLGTLVEDFKKSEELKNTKILQPLFNSLRVRVDKRDKSIKYVEFSSSIGLTNPEDESIMALEHLRQSNYPLFEKIIKYNLIVPQVGSTTTIRRFIPNYYLDGIGISDTLRFQNASMNSSLEQPNFSSSIEYGGPKLTQQLLQTLQHFPWYAHIINPSKVDFKDTKRAAFTVFSNDPSFTYSYNRKSGTDGRLLMNGEPDEITGLPGGAIKVPYEVVSFNDASKYTFRLYKISEVKDGIITYHEIDRLGSPNLSEFNASKSSDPNPVESILKSNKAAEPFPKQQVFQPENPQPIDDPKAENYNSNNVEHLKNRYNYDENKSGEENTRTFLQDIKKNAKNASYQDLAEILLAVDKQQGTLSGVNLNLSDKNEYNSNSKTLNLDMGYEPERFNKVFEYNLLHELLHHYTISKMSDGSTISRTINSSFDEMIKEMEKPENLQKAINELGLKTTPQELISKLGRLRAEQGKSTEESQEKFTSAEERAILNPLINRFELVSSLMTDRGTQRAFSKVSYKATPTTFLSKFLNLLKTLFDSFKRHTGLKMSSSVVDRGIDKVAEILAKDPPLNPDLKNEDLYSPKKLTPIEEEKLKLEKILKDPLKGKSEVTAKLHTRIRVQGTLSDRLNSVYSAIDHTYTTLPEGEGREKALEPLRLQLEQLKESIDNLTGAKFTIEQFAYEGHKALDQAQDIINKPVVSLYDLTNAIYTIEGQVALGKEINDGYTNKDKVVVVHPDLLRQIRELTGRAIKMREDGLNKSLDFTVEDYKTRMNDPGADRDTLTKGYEHSPFGISEQALSGLHTDKLPGLHAKTAYDYRKEQNGMQKVIEHENTKLGKDFAHLMDKTGNAPDLYNTYEQQDPTTGRMLKKEGYRLAQSPDFYKNLRDLPLPAKRQQAFIPDYRILEHEEFNKEAGKEVFNSKDLDKYRKNLLKRLGDSQPELTKEALEKKTDKMLSWYKTTYIDKYIKDKNDQIKVIEAQYPEDKARQEQVLSDWLAKESPFHILDETYERSPDAIIKPSQQPHRKGNPLTSERDSSDKPIQVPWRKANSITGKIELYRTAGRRVPWRPLRKDFAGKETGNVDETFYNWETEYFNKILPEIESGNRVSPLSYYEFHTAVLDQQKKILDHLSWYKRQSLGLKPWSKVDIQKDGKEMLQEAKGVYKIVMAAKVARDKVVQTLLKRIQDEGVHQIDLLTGDTKHTLGSPSSLSDSLNEQGLGDFKTNNVQKYLNELASMALSVKYSSILEPHMNLTEYLYKNYSITEANDNPDRQAKKFEHLGTKERIEWERDKLVYGVTPQSLVKPSMNTGKALLTTQEKAEVTRRKETISSLKDILRELKAEDPETADYNPIKIAEIEEKITKQQEKVDKIQRGTSAYQIYSGSKDLIRLVDLGFATNGRLTHIIQHTLSMNYEAADGRVFGFKDYAHGEAMAMRAYGMELAGGGALTYAVVKGLATLHPEVARHWAEVGGSIWALEGVINKVIPSLRDDNFQEKTNFILSHTGAFERTDLLSEAKYSQMLKGKYKFIEPFSLVESAAMYMNARTDLSVLHATKIKDLEGISRPLHEAFSKQDNTGEIGWNTKEFGTQDSHKMNFTGENSEKWKEVTNKIEGVRARLNGDFSDYTAQLAQKPGFWNETLFLRKYSAELLNEMLQKERYDPRLGMQRVGFVRQGVLEAKMIAPSLVKGEGIPDHKDHEKAALRKLLLWTIMSSIAIGGAKLFIAHHQNLIKQQQLSQQDDEFGDEDPDAQAEKDSQDTSFQDWLMLTNSIERAAGQEFNPYLVAKQWSGYNPIKSIAPQFGYLNNLLKLGLSLPGLITGNDNMKHREMLSHDILQPNKQATPKDAKDKHGKFKVDPEGNPIKVPQYRVDQKLVEDFQDQIDKLDPEKDADKIKDLQEKINALIKRNYLTRNKYPPSFLDPEISRSAFYLKNALPFSHTIQSIRTTINRNNLLPSDK